MIRIGEVQGVYKLPVGTTVAVACDRTDQLHLQIGDCVHFGRAGEKRIEGLKMWPEKKVIDLVIDTDLPRPEPGEPVYLVGQAR